MASKSTPKAKPKAGRKPRAGRVSTRESFSAAEQTRFTTEVGGKCPKCGKKLFYTKLGKSFKGYEIAHIYPLNPTLLEVAELAGEERLSDDPNHFDNLIALCVKCHTEFDKPRSAQEYREMVARKKALLRRAEQVEIQTQYPIEDDIRRLIDGLYAASPGTPGPELDYDPKRVDEKLNASMTLPTQQKIRHNVADYYQFVREKFVEIERESPTCSELISAQVKAFYLKQKSLGLPQQEVFQNVVGWLQARANPRTVEAAEIVASYYVQNCEVFE